MSASRTGRMSDIVETIQAEQDHIIRSALAGVLVVQGGPGTGKTAVALHRAAYLLYTHRRQLLKRGVLVVGPNTTFLRYIGQVLPSLGETSVLLSTMAGLYPGITATAAEPAEVAVIKGSQQMARVVTAAVRDRQQVPDGGLEVIVRARHVRAQQAGVRQGPRTSPAITPPAQPGQARLRPGDAQRPDRAGGGQAGRERARRGQPAR